jgi:hypothetical protein
VITADIATAARLRDNVALIKIIGKLIDNRKKPEEDDSDKETSTGSWKLFTSYQRQALLFGSAQDSTRAPNTRCRSCIKIFKESKTASQQFLMDYHNNENCEGNYGPGHLVHICSKGPI